MPKPAKRARSTWTSAGSEAGESDVFDLGADDSGAADDDLDFLFDESTAESPTIETIGTEKTVEMPAPEGHGRITDDRSAGRRSRRYVGITVIG